MKLKIGNSVRVKDGVMDGEFPEFALGGYQGRIADISKDDTGMVLISVEWDSLSLRQLPNSYIEQSIEAELDWLKKEVYLGRILAETIEIPIQDHFRSS